MTVEIEKVPPLVSPTIEDFSSTSYRSGNLFRCKSWKTRGNASRLPIPPSSDCWPSSSHRSINNQTANKLSGLCTIFTASFGGTAKTKSFNEILNVCVTFGRFSSSRRLMFEHSKRFFFFLRSAFVACSHECLCLKGERNRVSSDKQQNQQLPFTAESGQKKYFRGSGKLVTHSGGRVARSGTEGFIMQIN